jgi:hypothetical protein
VTLGAGETITVSFNVSFEELGFYNYDNIWTNEPGKHSFYIDNLHATFNLK